MSVGPIENPFNSVALNLNSSHMLRPMEEKCASFNTCEHLKVERERERMKPRVEFGLTKGNDGKLIKQKIMSNKINEKGKIKKKCARLINKEQFFQNLL
jgi:hypothetical protein